MKTRNTIKPVNLYEIQGYGEKVNVIFNDLDSIVEVQGQDGIEYEYWHYISEMVNNPSYIEEHHTELYEMAKENEYNKVAEEVRAKRRTLLEETDNYAMTDRVMSEEMKEYRQALRDITSQEGFPYDVVYPVKPEK